jgi:hypothetical protein
LRKNTLIALIAGALLISLITVGCGGGDSDSSSAATSANANSTTSGDSGTTSSNSASEDSTDGEVGGNGSAAKAISKPVFIEKASDICVTTARRIGSESLVVIEESNIESINDEVEASLVEPILIPAFETEIEEIRALGTPKGDEAQIESILTAIQEIIDAAEEEPELVTRPKPYAAIEARAKSYGMSACPMN